MSLLYELRNRHFFVLDVLLLPIAAYLSFVLRLDTYRLGSPIAMGADWLCLLFLAADYRAFSIFAGGDLSSVLAVCFAG
jgi:hypothetical protein